MWEAKRPYGHWPQGQKPGERLTGQSCVVPRGPERRCALNSEGNNQRAYNMLHGGNSEATGLCGQTHSLPNARGRAPSGLARSVALQRAPYSPSRTSFPGRLALWARGNASHDGDDSHPLPEIVRISEYLLQDQHRRVSTTCLAFRATTSAGTVTISARAAAASGTGRDLSMERMGARLVRAGQSSRRHKEAQSLKGNCV